MTGPEDKARTAELIRKAEEQENINWGEGADEPLTCGIENPEQCESCT